MSALALRIQSRIWRWVLILGPILVLALAFQALWTLHVTTAHPDSDDLSIETDRVARLVDAYLARVAGVTSFLTLAPDVVELAKAGSERPFTRADEDAEKNWVALARATNDPFKLIKDLPVSLFFKNLTASGGAFREIFLTDTKGRVIAASNRTENFLQGHDPWWPEHLDRVKASCRRLPLECVRITDVKWDASAAVFGYDVVLPVMTPEGHQVVGVLKAVVDPTELDALLKFASSSQQVDVALVNAKGRRLLSRERFFDEKAASRLSRLPPGSEDSLRLSGSREDGPVAFVRRLSSPLDGGWSVAVADRGEGDSELWKPYALWCLFTLGMFVIAARAFGVTAPRNAETPVERATS
jgi:hypothetical protein